MRYSLLLMAWLSAYFLTGIAGEWWYSHFQIYQALVSFGLLLISVKLVKEWWGELFGYLCILQILLNLGDAIFDYPISNYNRMLDLLNLSELITLFVIGPIGIWHRKRTNDHHNNGDSGMRRVPIGRS